MSLPGGRDCPAQEGFALTGNCWLRDEFGASVWRLVQGSRRWGASVRGEGRAPRGSLLVLRSLGAAGSACGQCCRSGASLVHLPFFPGHGLPPAALTCCLLTRGHSTGPSHLGSHQLCCRHKQSCEALRRSVARVCRACRLPGLGGVAGGALAPVLLLLITAAGRRVCKGLVSSMEQLKSMLLKISF